MRKNILIVEDNKAAAEMLQRTIEEMGRDINVYIAHNSMEAYEKALQHTIDIFFLDIILNTGENAKYRKISVYTNDIYYFIDGSEIIRIYQYSQLCVFGKTL